VGSFPGGDKGKEGEKERIFLSAKNRQQARTPYMLFPVYMLFIYARICIVQVLYIAYMYVIYAPICIVHRVYVFYIA